MNAAEETPVRFLMVQAGGVEYLLPLARVQRVLAGLRLFPFPGASPAVAGLAQAGGEPLVVLDVERLVGAAGEPRTESAVIVIARAGPPEALETVGLSVDAALDIVELPVAAISRVHDGLVCGEASVAGRAARVLDLGALAGGA